MCKRIGMNRMALEAASTLHSRCEVFCKGAMKFHREALSANHAQAQLRRIRLCFGQKVDRGLGWTTEHSPDRGDGQ
jgi:hypothetical protein